VPQDLTWLRPLSCADEGPILFAFPPAGAGPNVFRPWLSWLPAHLELVAVKAPGREDRIGQEPAVRGTGASMKERDG
jgi:surfactin synthase thioesterase subunit